MLTKENIARYSGNSHTATSKKQNHSVCRYKFLVWLWLHVSQLPIWQKIMQIICSASQKTGKNFYRNFIGKFYACIFRTNMVTDCKKKKHGLSSLVTSAVAASVAYRHLHYELCLILIWLSESRRGAARLAGLYSATVRQPTASHQRRTRLHVGRLPSDEASVHFGPAVKIKSYSL